MKVGVGEVWGDRSGRLGGDWRWPENGDREHEKKPRAGGLGLPAAGCLRQLETGGQWGAPGGKIVTDWEELQPAAPRM